MDWKNVEAFGPSDEIKFVVADEADYCYAKKIIKEKRLLERTPKVYLSPCWPADNDMTFVRQLCNWMIRDRMQAKLSLQQHKVIYGPTLRGV
jgi:7-carboxy-7-deazaguanine synthase